MTTTSDRLLRRTLWANAMLSVGSGALLAALIRSPSYYDPFKNPEVAEERRHIVFMRLLATKRVNKKEAALYEQVELGGPVRRR